MRAELAQAALAAVEAGHPGLPGASRDLAADLAVQAGDTELAARLLTESGRDSLRRGALATAASTLQRACGLAGAEGLRRPASALLAEALALAGRVDECMSAGAAALGMSATAAPAARAQIHLAVAHAAVEAARWPVAADQLASAERLLAEDPDPALTQRWRVLAAETALAERDVAAARQLAELVLESAAATAEVRCHALGLLGRSHRARDLDAARLAFEKALACAEMANLPLWRLRALHELGTIELFEQAGTGRLGQALRTATDLGALSMAAVLDIQLAAAYLFRFDPGREAAAPLRRSPRRNVFTLPSFTPPPWCSWPSWPACAATARRWSGSTAWPSRPLPGLRRWRDRCGAAGESPRCWTATKQAPARRLPAPWSAWRPFRTPAPASTSACGRCCWPCTQTPARAMRSLCAAHRATVNRANRGMLLYARHPGRPPTTRP